MGGAGGAGAVQESLVWLDWTLNLPRPRQEANAVRYSAPIQHRHPSDARDNSIVHGSESLEVTERIPIQFHGTVS